MICANSCFLLCRFCAHGDKLPGDLCGVKSDQTRDTCWSRMSWSVSSSSSSSLALNASAKIFPPLFADRSTWVGGQWDFVRFVWEVAVSSQLTSSNLLWNISFFACSLAMTSSFGIKAFRNASSDKTWDLGSIRWVRGIIYGEFMGWEMKRMR